MSDLDILNEQNDIDLSSVDTSYPILPKNLYKFTVADIKIVPGKTREGSKVLEVKCELAEDAVAISGRHINAGFPLTFRIGLTPTEKYTESMRNESLARFMDAVVGESARKANGKLQPIERFMGQTFQANLLVKEDEQFGTRNEFGRLIKKD
jgi:hypothetical protein